MIVRLSFRALALLLALLGGSRLVSGCANRAVGVSPDTDDQRQTAAISLQLPNGDFTLLAMNYTITGPGGFDFSGTIDLTNSTTIKVVIAGIPAGGGYDIALTGIATDGVSVCAGSSSFSTVLGMTSHVSVNVTCQMPVGNGGVSVGSTINVCPVIDGLNAIPGEVTLGSTLSLSATAHDTDNGPTPLAYHWSASAGMLSDPSSPAPTFTCTSVGPATVTLVVSDGDPSPACADTLDVTVNCSKEF